MANPAYGAGIIAYFKDLGAVKGLGALTGATNNLSKSLKELRDKTFATTGTVRNFSDSGKEAALDMSTGLARTAVLQGKVYTQTSDIMSQQLDATVQAAENASTIQQLQRDFESVGKSSVKNIGAFAKLQKVLEVPGRTLASWDKTLEAQGFSEEHVIDLTKELGGLAVKMHVDPGPLLSGLEDSTKLIMERAALLGKEGPAFIQKYMKENVALSAALTSVGLHADDAGSSVGALGRLTFDSAKEMKKAMAGVANTDLPHFLQMSSITLGDFPKAFELAAEKGPLALAQTFSDMTEKVRRDSKGNKVVMGRWRAFMDDTLGDPALASAIIDHQVDIGKAVAATNAPIESNIKAYGNLEDAILKNAKALRDRRDAGWEALKAEAAQKAVIPFMTDFWNAQNFALDKARGLLESWTKSANPATQATAGLAGATILYSGDVLDWTVKAGGAIKNLQEFKGAAFGLAKVISGSSVASMGQLVVAMGPLVLIVGGIVAAFAAMDWWLGKNAEKQLAAGNAATENAKKQQTAMELVTTAAKAGNKDAIIMRASLLAVSREAAEAAKPEQSFFYTKTEKKRLEDARAKQAVVERGIGKMFGKSPLAPASSPTPVMSSGAFPPGASSVRVAIQGLEEQRAQTHLLEQIAMLLGGVGGGGGGTPGRGGGGGVTVEIRPDSGPMQLHKMLRATARSTLGRGGYNQFGGTVFAN